MSDLPEDQWPEPDLDEAACDTCDNIRPCCYTSDPFIDEVYPEDPSPCSWWCLPCYSERRAQV